MWTQYLFIICFRYRNEIRNYPCTVLEHPCCKGYALGPDNYCRETLLNSGEEEKLPNKFLRILLLQNYQLKILQIIYKQAIEKTLNSPTFNPAQLTIKKIKFSSSSCWKTKVSVSNLQHSFIFTKKQQSRFIFIIRSIKIITGYSNFYSNRTCTFYLIKVFFLYLLESNLQKFYPLSLVRKQITTFSCESVYVLLLSSDRFKPCVLQHDL